jgi:thioredoxin reductase (NADPH)
MPENFDIIIVGGGPASLSAAIYAGRAELKTLVLERMVLGGQVASTYQIDNYPGFPEGIDGPDLIQRMEAHARRFGTEFRSEEVTHIALDADAKVVTTRENVYRSRTLILATGADPRKLHVPGEEELRGRGVSYCGTCDGPFFRKKHVVVVGGGDSACKEALFIARFAEHITIVLRSGEFRAEKVCQTEVRKHPGISVEFNTVVERINGTERVASVTVRDARTGKTRDIACDGVFIFIGHEPNTGFLCNLFPNQCMGEIETDLNMMSSIPGIFVIGDVRKNSYRQIATAVGEGATAAIAAEHYIAEHANPKNT